MSKYYPVSKEEITDLLKTDKGWTPQTEEFGNTKELVFNYPLRNHADVTVKVYTGIKADSGESRGCGKDAIRVCAVRYSGGKGYGWIKSKRVHRVEGWRTNLQKRVVDVIREANGRFA